MKVVLKVTIYDRICDDIAKARRDRRVVDYIAVSPAENRELIADERSYAVLDSGLRYCLPSGPSTAAQSFQTRDFPRVRRAGSDSQYQPTYRVVTHEKFMGIDLYVVPAEYMPA